jgi:hypothetical protein
VQAAAGRRRLVRWVETVEPEAVVEPAEVVAWEVESLGFAPITSGWWTFRVTLDSPSSRTDGRARHREDVLPGGTRPMKRRRTRRGIALMLVAVSTATTLGAWSLAARQVAALVRIKAALQAREEATSADPDRCRVRALAYGLALLETGHPPVPRGRIGAM